MGKILAVGGGSGGHVTPVVAVCRELRKSGHDEIRFWCDKKFSASARAIFAKYDATILVQTVVAGKFRRYHGMGWKIALHPTVFFPNLLDLFKAMIGFMQSFVRLIIWRPDVIFLKGGYVCLPVGYAARALRIPLVIHDSDAHPGLTNRLLAPFAKKIGTGAPLKYYSYPAHKARYVGIPIAPEFRPYADDERASFKRELGFDEKKPLVVVTGGGLGATRINNAVVCQRDSLLEKASIFLISGAGQYDELADQCDERDGWRLEAFVHERMAHVLAAADIVVARAGATTLLELAALHKPTIIIPNGRLTAGHQLKNAKVYQDALAAVILTEDELEKNPQSLVKKIDDLLSAPTLRRELGEHFGAFARPDAARDMAEMIREVMPTERGAGEKK